MSVVLLALAARAPAEDAGPSVLILKSDGTEARGRLLSFERGSYTLATKSGKELEMPATEIDLVRFHRRKGVQTLPMPPTPSSAGEETRRRRGPPEELAGLDKQLRKLKKEGRLGEFVKDEEEALRRSENARDAMRHLLALHRIAAAEYGPDSPQAQKRVRDLIGGIENPMVRKQVGWRVAALGWLRRPERPRRRGPIR